MIPQPNPFAGQSSGYSIMTPALRSAPTPSAPPTAPPTSAQTAVSSAAQPAGTRIGRYVVDSAAIQMPNTASAQSHAAASSSSVSGAPSQPSMRSPAPVRPTSPAPPASANLQYSQTASASQIAYVNPDYQCSDSFMAMTQMVVPVNAALQQKSKLPFGVALHPLNPAEAVPLVNMGPHGIIRCKTCRAYMNPFVEWLEGGRRWRCNLCGIVNDVTGAYFSPLTGDGVRVDAPNRPELSSGIVDFVAPAEYLVRPPMAPAYLFVVDVSYYAVYSGMVVSMIKGIREALQYLPGGERSRFGFITYDSSVTLYSLSGISPKAIVVNDVDDESFVPVAPESVLVNLHDKRSNVMRLLDTLEALYAPARAGNVAATMDTCLGPALRCAHDVGKNWGCRVMAFVASISKKGANWGFSNREQELGKLVGTENESTLFRGAPPVVETVKKLAVEMSKAQTSCDIFSFVPYVDLATVSPIVQLTGGQIYYYGSDANRTDSDREKLFYDVFFSLTKEQFWEGVMRLRCSKGVSINPGSIFGNFHIRSSDLLALPVLDSEKGFTFSLKVEENLTAIRKVSFQVALLYTTSNHERRIRVLNKCLPVTSSMADLFRTANADVLADLIFKAAAKKAIDFRPSQAREGLINTIADILHVYKATFSANVSGELVIPESLKMLPVYVLGMVKSPILRVAIGERVDRRMHMLISLNYMPYHRSVTFAYPKLYAAASAVPNKLSQQSVTESGGVVLLDTAHELLLLVARTADPGVLAHVFAVTSFEQVDPAAPLPLVDSPTSTQLHETIAATRSRCATWARLTVIKEGEARWAEAMQWLVEDRMNQPPLPSFQEFVRQLQGLASKQK